MESIWQKSTERVSFAPLEGNKNTDVLIIGGGMAGILCADRLCRAGVDCILVEANHICGGVSGNTTAKVTLTHGLLYHTLIRRFGAEQAGLYLKAQQQALSEYAGLCEKIDCDYRQRDAFVYTLRDKEKVAREIAALKLLGVAAESVPAEGLPFAVKGALRVREQAELNPLKLLYTLAKDLPIYEKTKVQELVGNRAITSRGEINFERLVVATHFPIFNKHGLYFLKMYQHRSYVLALEGAADVGGLYVDENDAGLSFRNYGKLLLLGGGGHRTGKSGGCWQELEKFAAKHYPHARIVAKWATQDCMTLDGMPYIGRYGGRTSDAYVATGFNKWGMTSSMVSAMLLADLICGKVTPYQDLFSPSRSIWRPQLVKNIFHSTVGLLTPTRPRCPHLGCALKYNAAEHSWDCPCHGSRFSTDGTLLNGPATDDKKQ
ncbi:MAG: FAD-dependent oxidoreductase [Clostridia bacterium]|nr:FAD-dependent oxidoreductase [Clostridia bacterium]